MRAVSSFLVLGLIVLLGACGSGGTADNAAAPGSNASPSSDSNTTTTTTTTTTNNSGSCTFVTGGSTAVSSTTESGCTSCSISNPKQAADGDASTAATIKQTQASPNAGIALRVTAQPGIVFAAGSRAGARMTLPGSTGPGQTSGLALRTYMSGTLQESHTVVTPQTCGGACNSGQTSSQSQTFKTTKPFDAIEVYVYGGSSATSIDAAVTEFCTN